MKFTSNYHAICVINDAQFGYDADHFEFNNYFMITKAHSNKGSIYFPRRKNPKGGFEFLWVGMLEVVSFDTRHETIDYIKHETDLIVLGEL